MLPLLARVVESCLLSFLDRKKSKYYKCQTQQKIVKIKGSILMPVACLVTLVVGQDSFLVIKKQKQSKKMTREQQIQHLTKGNTNFASGRHQSPDNVFKPVLICRQEALIYAAQEGLTRITPNMFTHSGTWNTIYVQSGEDTKSWLRITEAPHQCYRAGHCSHV